MDCIKKKLMLSLARAAGGSQPAAAGVGRGLAFAVTLGATLLMCFYSMHSSYVSSLAYSSPSIVIEAGRTQSGQRILYDDYREVCMHVVVVAPLMLKRVPFLRGGSDI